MIPCVKNKCLMQAACKDKHHIDCPDLMEFANELEAILNIGEVWRVLKAHFKNIQSFKNPKHSFMII